jgi:flagellar assembly protein FliH
MSLSNGGRFSEEELELLSLWALPNVSEDENENHQAEPENNRSPLMTVSEIEQMQAKAQEEAFAKGHEEGFAQGYQEGQAKGYEEGLKKGYEENFQLLSNQAAELFKVMEMLSEPLKNLDEAVENELVKLAITMATQIIRREIKLDPGQIIAAVREAVGILPVASQKITLTLHPADAELVRTVLVLDEISPPWVLIEDPLITRGGCKVDTEMSRVDATIETRVSAVVAKVLGGGRSGDEES